MNVSVYTTFGFPFGGAPENCVRQICLGLKENKVNVRVTRLKGSNYPVPESYPIHSRDLIYRSRPKNILVFLTLLCSSILYIPIAVLIEKWIYKTRVIFLFSADYPHFCVPFLLACRLVNIKLFRMVTDHFDEQYIVTSWWKKIKIPLMDFQFRVVDKYLDGIIVVTEYLKKMIIKNGVPESRILLIPHFIDTNAFFREDIQNKKSKQLVTFGFCGDSNVQNGVLDLLIAFEKTEAHYKNTRLIIIGKRFPELDQHLSALQNSQLLQKIEITGFVPSDMVQQKLNQCDVLINPRRNGRFAEAGFPTKLGEYFSTRLPVISTITGDIRKYFSGDKELLLTSPEDPSELSEAMIKLITDEFKRKEIGECGYRWASQHLDYKSNALKLKHFLENSNG